MTKREKMHRMQELKKYKKEAIIAARELFYPPEIESKIRNANSEAEVSKIMFNQRLKMYAQKGFNNMGEKEILKDNLNAFVKNFGEVRIEKENFGAGYYVFSPSTSESYVQYCYNIDYLNGWLYGCVQGAMKCVKFTEERKHELEG